MKNKTLAFAIAAAFAASPVVAQEETEFNSAHDNTGFYALLEIGQLKLKDYCGIYPDIQSEFQCEDAEIGYGISGGYWFNDYFAAEGGVRVADGFDLRYIDTFNDTITAKADFRNISLGMRGRFPFGERFAATGKIGAHFWKQEIDLTDSSFGRDVSKEDGIDLYFGAGAEVNLTDNIAVRAEYTRYNGDTLDADVISGSVVWNF